MEFPNEFCFIGDLTEDDSLGDSLSDRCEELFQRGKIRDRIYRSFFVLFCFLLKNITHVVEYQKIAPNHERQTLKDFSAFLGKMQECGLTEMISRDAS